MKQPLALPAPLGITMGDAAGIGPEIIVKLFHQGLPAPAVVFGDAGILQRAIHRLGLAQRLDVQAHVDITQAVQVNGGQTPHGPTPVSRIPVINGWQPLPLDLPDGQVNALAGRGAYEYLCQAIAAAQDRHIRAIVTAPLHKAAMQAAGVDFPGHTEILAQRSGTPDVAMMLVNEELRVMLVTVHEALARVPSLLTEARELRTLQLAHQACVQMGIKTPRIAVAGLNPHAGENGRFGQEERDIIAPAIAQAQAAGIHASGPWPGDTVFMRARQGEFDIVVAQYHDQGLIPVKYLGLDQGVNTTVGLPFVRTSVDHGTAFDIAGKGIADPSSLQAAFELALRLTANKTPA